VLVAGTFFLSCNLSLDVFAPVKLSSDWPLNNEYLIERVLFAIVN